MTLKYHLLFSDSNDQEPSHCSFDTWKEMLRPPTRRPLMLVIPYFILQQFSGMTSIRPFMVHVFRHVGLHDAAEWTTVSRLAPFAPAQRLPTNNHPRIHNKSRNPPVIHTTRKFINAFTKSPTTDFSS